MDDIQKLLKETIAEILENGLDAELDEGLGCSKNANMKKMKGNTRNGHSRGTMHTSFRDGEVPVLPLTSDLVGVIMQARKTCS